MDSYEKRSEVLEKLKPIQAGATQVYRLTDADGKGAEDVVNAERILGLFKSSGWMHLNLF